MTEFTIDAGGGAASYITRSADETEALGASLGEKIKKDFRVGKCARFIALSGGLGAGKTAFVRGIASVISPKSAVKSPTYTIVNEYRRGDVPLFHFDLCRISGEDDLYSTGYYEYLEGGICAVEWSDAAPWALPDERWDVKIKTLGENERLITIELKGGTAK
ncbi:MAG: tRNA (adenosine(37)-N6)-threonylcarbamoyltransferase complex ATPase subunit type 1 TsaE [Firmicutes bacterium]|nr:tRNA (adenosine(37)-N6)-threonylcarbamoyltransferase complex ATPase subunit type 1 TsaE [Bacillota bacterium]